MTLETTAQVVMAAWLPWSTTPIAFSALAMMFPRVIRSPGLTFHFPRLPASMVAPGLGIRDAATPVALEPAGHMRLALHFISEHQRSTRTLLREEVQHIFSVIKRVSTAWCTCTAPLGLPVVALVKCPTAMSWGSVDGSAMPRPAASPNAGNRDIARKT